MNISRLTRRSAIAGLGLVALAACSSEDEEPAVAEDQPAPEDQEASDGGEDDQEASDGGGEDTADDADSEDAAPAGDETEVEIGHEFEDPETGDVFTVRSAVRNVDSEAGADVIAEGGEIIYLLVSVVPSDEFGGAISGRDFEIADGESSSSTVGDLEEELESSDRDLWERPRRMDGEFEGYIALMAETAADSYTVIYTRGEAEILGEDETIDEFSEEFEIPAA